MKKLILAAAIVAGAFVAFGGNDAQAGWGCYYPSYGYQVRYPVYRVNYYRAYYPAYYGGYGCYHW